MFQTLIAQFEEHDRRIFWTLVSLLVLALGGYLYFLGMSVHAVVERRAAESEMRTLHARISELEATYAGLDKDIDLALARERGFVDVSVPQYLSVRKGETALSLVGMHERQ